MEKDIITLAEKVGQTLLKQNLLLCTAESCTGGWVAQAISGVEGCSAWFERGFVTYSNTAKQEMLGVPVATIGKFGAVSQETAKAMAEGALQNSHADISIAITGIAGPSGGSKDKPVGLVWFAISQRSRSTLTFSRQFKGDRTSVREQAVICILEKLCTLSY